MDWPTFEEKLLNDVYEQAMKFAAKHPDCNIVVDHRDGVGFEFRAVKKEDADAHNRV